MKKRVLCIFSLVLYLLVACTILSVKIEDEMMTEVYTYRLNNRGFGGMGPQILPMNLVFREEYMPHVYHLQEGTGWNTGLRVQELESRDYTVGERLELTNTYGDWTFIALASRQPRVGEPVKVIEQLKSPHMDDLETAAQDYLLIYPETVPTVEMLIPPKVLENYESIPQLQDLLPEGASVTAQSDNALLLHLPEAPVPFTENSAGVYLTNVEMMGWRIISLADVESFLSQLPLVALLAVLVLVLPLGIWVYSCLLARDEWNNRTLIRVNIGMAMVLIVGTVFLVRSIDLPASLLPPDIVFDGDHYRQIFGLVNSAMESLGSAGERIPELAAGMERRAWGILGAGAAVTAAIGLAELSVVLARKRRKKSA